MQPNVFLCHARHGSTRKGGALSRASAEASIYMASFQMPAKSKQPNYEVLTDFRELLF